jgi:chemotaxis protein methyltransferase CheR
MTYLADAVDDIETDLFVEAVWRRYRYDFRQYARGSLQRRLQRAQDQLGCESLSQLQHRLLHDDTVLPRLLGFLTIQVSEMYRDPAYFLQLRQTVLPHLATWPSIKVWVAGCANGEEFYSLAIMFREEGLEDRTIFYCTDINPAALEKARAGIYDIDKIADYSRNYAAAGGSGSLADYYTAGFGAARFDPTLRNRAVFADHNLASDAVFSETHFVSSRNVLIYFDRPLQDRAFALFAGSLHPGGFLGLGSRETVAFSSQAPLFDEFAANEKIYRRNSRPIVGAQHA